ncbi:procathepsin L-like [Drosophila ficusphila]|uniref:procathepsin L-like n=1 Tax=Drosophila ficusphila TaxID=30025 RepID=UPI0007E7675A|nr:procathepsin L-like [Drosophila ficusphila]
MSSLRLRVLQVLLPLILVELGMALVDSDEEWAQYKAKYNKHYTFNDNYHRGIYRESVQAVAKYNRLFAEGKVGFKLGLNERSDVDESVFFRSGTKRPLDSGTNSVTKTPSYKYYDEINEGIDWRQYGYISPVENQTLGCQSCWAFSSSGCMEAHLAMKNGKLEPLSPKHLIDCVPSPVAGCNGGWATLAFRYAKNHSIASKKSYPYEPQVGTCAWENPNGILEGHVTLKNNDEREMAEVVYNIGPVTASIDYLDPIFKNYKGGVVNIPNCRKDRKYLNHSMLVVGFGTHPISGDYWLIKNSYGTEWGENGYMRLARNENNTCGIASYIQYPILSKNNL